MLNVVSLPKHLDEIRLLLHDKYLDVLAVNETRGALHSKKAYGIFGFLKIRGFFSGFSPDFLADF